MTMFPDKIWLQNYLNVVVTIVVLTAIESSWKLEMTLVCHFVKENGFTDMQLSNLLLSKITEFMHFCWFLFPVISGNRNCSFETNGLLLVTMWNGPFNSNRSACQATMVIQYVVDLASEY